MVTVKTQTTDVFREMGCFKVRPSDLLCVVLLAEEKRLEAKIVTEALKWYDSEK